MVQNVSRGSKEGYDPNKHIHNFRFINTKEIAKLNCHIHGQMRENGITKATELTMIMTNEKEFGEEHTHTHILMKMVKKVDKGNQINQMMAKTLKVVNCKEMQKKIWSL